MALIRRRDAGVFLRPRLLAAVFVSGAALGAAAANAPAAPFPAPLPVPVQDTAGAVATRLARGEELLERGEPDRALKEFQIALSIDGDAAEAHAGVVRALLASREKERAVEAGRKAAERLPGNPVVLVALGQAELASTNFAGARDAAEKALESKEAPAAAWRLKADAAAALSAEGSPAGEGILREALKTRSGDPALQFELGDFLASWGRTKDALAPLAAAASGLPGRVDVRLRLARAHLAEKQPVEARRFLAEALEIDPENARAHSLMGRSYEDAGEAAAAASNYEKAVRLQPKNALHHLDLGYVTALIEGKDRWKDAERELRTALKLDDSLVEARLHLGWVLNRQGKLKDALDEYAVVLKGNPDHARALYYAADLLIVLGKTQEAEKHLLRLQSLRPQDPDVHRLLATISFDMGKMEEARKRIDRALEMAPKNARSLLLSGRILEEGEKHEEAEKVYLAAVEADAAFSWPHLYLGELYEIWLDKPEEALKAYKRYLELGGKDEDGDIQRRIDDLEG